MVDGPSDSASVLLSGNIPRVWSGPLSVAGHYSLTRATLSFRPTGPLAGMLRDQAIAVALVDLQFGEWRNMRSRLVLNHRGGQLVFEGSPTTRLAVGLQAMGLPFVAEGAPPDARPKLGHLQRVEAVNAISGLVQRAGWLAIGDAGIFFESRGLVEHLAGLKGIRIPWAEFRRADVYGKELRIHGQNDSLSVLVNATTPLISLMSDRLATLDPPEDIDLSPPPTEAGDESLGSYGGTCWVGEPAGLRWGRAWLARESGLCFVGVDGEMERADAATVQRSVYGRSSDDPHGELRIERGVGGPLRLRPAGGIDDLLALRNLALSLPMVDAASLGELGRLRALAGEVTYGRITSNHTDAVGFRPAWLVQAPDGIGLVMKGSVDWKLPRGTRVRFTVGIDRGVYTINGRILRLAELPPSELGPGFKGGEEDQTVLFIGIPHIDEIDFLRTRRNDYRVPTSEDIQIRDLRWIPGSGRQPVGQSVPGRLIDLSASGCGIFLRHELTVGHFIETRVLVSGRPERFAAEVVHVTKVTEDDQEWFRHGLRFAGLDAADSARLAREVRRRETRAVRSADDHPEDPDAKAPAPGPAVLRTPPPQSPDRSLPPKPAIYRSGGPPDQKGS